MPIYDDVNDGVFDFTPFGKCVFKPSIDWTNTPRDDIIQFDTTTDMPELTKDLKLGTNISLSDKNKITDIIKEF